MDGPYRNRYIPGRGIYCPGMEVCVSHCTFPRPHDSSASDSPLGWKRRRSRAFDVAPVLLCVTCFLIAIQMPATGSPCGDARPHWPGTVEEGPYSVDQLNDQVALSSGGSVNIVVYYPGYSSRIERIQRISEGPFPVVIFSPGFMADAEAEYYHFMEPLATYGCVVVGASWIYEEDREDDTVYMEHGTLLDYLDMEGGDWRSPLYGMPDTTVVGAFGHSRGGRTAFMASSVEPRIRAVAAWMPPLDNASQVEQSIPKLLFAGGEDEVCPPDVWQEPLYSTCDAPIVYLLRHINDHSVLDSFHGQMTLQFMRLHVLGETALEPELYGEPIKEQAATGEFRLRIKTSGEVYDSAPEADASPDGTAGDDPTGNAPTVLALAIIVVIAAAILFRRRLARLFRRAPATS